MTEATTTSIPYTANQKRVDAAIGGALSGMFAVTMSYPFDLIKTRLHFAVGQAKQAEAGAAAVRQPTLVSMAKLIGSEGLERPVLGMRPLGGFLAYFRGLDQLLPEAFFKVLFRFVAFNDIQNVYRRQIMKTNDMSQPLPFHGNIVAGTAAGFVEAAAVVQIFERGKTLRADYASPYKVWGDALRRGGVGAMLRSMYVGFVPCAGRQMGNQAASFSTFYYLKNLYLARTERKELGTVERLSFGFIGGCAGAAFTMPLDVTKSLAQQQTGAVTKGTIAIIMEVVRSRGILALYTGLAPRLMRVGLDRAFGFLAFEFIVEHLKRQRGIHKSNEH